MSWYLVEAYTSPNRTLSDIEARIELAVRASAGITHLASILIPEDETCFHIFDAVNGETVAGISETAGLSPLRIVETVHSEHWG